MRQAKAAATNVLAGSAFDKTYVAQQLSDHKETLALLQGEATGGNDPRLTAFAAKYILVVEEHISELEKLQQEIAQN